MSNATQLKNLAIGATVLASGAAHADLKLVTETTSGRPGTAMAAERATTYIKGNLVRKDMRGRYQILDTKTNRLILVDPVAKTYRTRDVADMASVAASRSSNVTIKAQVTPKATRKVAGRNAKGYTGTLSMSRPTPRGNSTSLKMEFEQWVDPTIGANANTSALLKMMDTLKGAGNFDATQKELAKMKGLALASSLTIKDGSGKIVSSTHSKTLSLQKVALPQSLFQIPKGFREVKSELPSLANIKKRSHDGHDH